MFRVLLAALCLSFALSSVRAEVTPDQLLDAVDLVEEMTEALPEEWTSVEGLVRVTGGDAGALAGWVGENIAYRPYAGTMRGAEGTLLTGAGNALDQALLLASALKAAGYEAQIVESAVDEAGVDALLARAVAQPLSLAIADPAVTERLNALGAEMATVLGEPGAGPDPLDADLSALKAEAQAGATRISAALAASAQSLQPEAALQALRAAIGPYHHVRWRLQASDPWQNAHPALGTAPDLPAEPLRILVDVVPDDLLHKVSIVAKIATTSPSGTRVEAVGEASIVVANALNWAPTYQAYPAGIANAQEFLSGDVAAVSRFTPMFGGGAMRRAKAFNLSGIAVDPSVLSSPAAGLFESLGEVTNDASGTLAAEGGARQTEVTRLTRHWLEITQTGPGTPPVTVERVLWEEGDGPPEPTARFYDLTQNIQLSWSPGPMTEAALTMAGLERVRLVLEALEEDNLGDIDFADAARDDLELPSLQLVQHRPDLGIEVRPRPSVAAVMVRLGAEDRRLISDLMLDGRFILAGDGIDTAATTELGVWASLTETLLLQGIADAAQIETDAISSAADRLLSAPDWAVERGSDTIRVGFAGSDVFSVDPATGLAIARDAKGIGQGQLTEYEMLLINIALTTYKAIVGTAKCNSGPPENYSACMRCVRTGALLAFGAMGAASATVAVSVVVVGDMVREVAC
ncbi:transglutaminase domain-containing protein [Acuticoccus sp. MNP-M23]|uniref:transglutaminase domain-containing protein n=1 Tax=Acuticoccus sp. MNP-M23 TaxID=3072793 RepID=UPI002815AE0E|nr:transglutaminase domain-containing protein [Acuticoccus sp. MNP-M23]WMS41954.1 transglutaminase domain-containing protein [Acuticoccus sp. MNP-M23]